MSTKKKGKNKYVPPIIMGEISRIKTSFGEDMSDNAAFTELARQARFGHEIESKMRNNLFKNSDKQKIQTS